jgi:outer membrane lipoprotein carrier protein
MTVRWRTALLAAMLVAASSIPRAATRERAPLGPIEGLAGWLEGTRDLTCRFEQRLLSGALGAGTRESGVFYLLRPGRLRWEYDDPEPKTAIVDGDRTLLFLPDDRQLIRGRLSPDEDLLPALLAGRGKIHELFDARVLEPAGTQDGVRVRLVPRSAPGGVQEITLTLRPPDYSIERAEVLDPAGNRMEYLFTKVRRNKGVPETLFTFEPPPGTEISGPP